MVNFDPAKEPPVIDAVSSPLSPPSAGPYSPGIVHAGVLYLAGQGPFDENGQRVGETFADQVRRTFHNLAVNAEAAGTSLDNTIRYGVYLKSLDDFAEFNELAKEFLSEPYPVRTTLQIELRGFDVEIDAIVAMP